MSKHLVFVESKAQKQFRKAPKEYQNKIIEVLNALEKEALLARYILRTPRVSKTLSCKAG